MARFSVFLLGEVMKEILENDTLQKEVDTLAVLDAMDEGNPLDVELEDRLDDKGGRFKEDDLIDEKGGRYK